MDRRGFLGRLGASAVAAAGVLRTSKTEIDALPPAIPAPQPLHPAGPGNRFAILCNIHGQAVKHFVVEGTPTEIHVAVDGRDEPTRFLLSSLDRWDGRTVEGIARYIVFEGPCPWDVQNMNFLR